MPSRKFLAIFGGVLFFLTLDEILGVPFFLSRGSIEKENKHRHTHKLVLKVNLKFVPYLKLTLPP